METLNKTVREQINYQLEVGLRNWKEDQTSLAHAVEFTRLIYTLRTKEIEFVIEAKKESTRVVSPRSTWAIMESDVLNHGKIEEDKLVLDRNFNLEVRGNRDGLAYITLNSRNEGTFAWFLPDEILTIKLK